MTAARWIGLDFGSDFTIISADFERWIADELSAIAGCVDRLMAASGFAFADIDRVFLTGGSSFLVRRSSFLVRRSSCAEPRTSNQHDDARRT